MPALIEDQVIDFYYALFDCLFSSPFQAEITQRLRRDAVSRQVQDTAGASSQSLTRFFKNQQVNKTNVAKILQSLAGLSDLLALDDISNPNVSPEALADELLPKLPGAGKLQKSEFAAVYRVALHSVMQVLLLVGAVLAEWRKLKFAETFELNRRVVQRLNQISEQLGEIGHAGQAAAAERYELTYRDYLLQRFHRVEAGTVRMTTNLGVDLRELFVMPRVKVRPLLRGDAAEKTDEAVDLMNLAAARAVFGEKPKEGEGTDKGGSDEQILSALELAKSQRRCVIIGTPGAGKSTFLEWLQLMIASAEEEMILNDQQAIPVLLKVRQLDPENLPEGPAIIERATASKDRATLMPSGWIQRQMKQGRVLFMLDGLDEVEPDLRDRYVLPWLVELCKTYPDCHYLVSSRPVGYAAGALAKLEFAECELLDFEDAEISDYTGHWCTAVRLARNETEDEARREGLKDGEDIVKSFRDQAYIRNLARNPLMLSAICLVNYFEGGELPRDRSKLYQLCVEGLLHHWDQRRGIRSDFTLQEKLRVCREIALTMQADDRAEYDASKVGEIFSAVLGDAGRASKLLKHVRYRTGLLVERRPGVFAFAHLTFQEYLAALAVHEGNRLGIETERLAREHDDGRWQEVIALYCGLAPSSAAGEVVEKLIAQADSTSLSTALAEAYLSSGAELIEDSGLRRRVLGGIATAPVYSRPIQLERFDPSEVERVANRFLGKLEGERVSESYLYLYDHPEAFDAAGALETLEGFRQMSPLQRFQVLAILHKCAPDATLWRLAAQDELYESKGESFGEAGDVPCQGFSVLYGLAARVDSWESSRRPAGRGMAAALVRSVSALGEQSDFGLPPIHMFSVDDAIRRLGKTDLELGREQRLSLTRALRRLASRLPDESNRYGPRIKRALRSWADQLAQTVPEKERQTRAQKA